MTQNIELERVACNLCGSASSHPLYVSYDRLHGYEGSYTAVRCAKCSLVYLDPRPTPRSLTLYYPEDYSCFHHTRSTDQQRKPANLSQPSPRWRISHPSFLNLAYSARRHWFHYPPRPGERSFHTNPLLAPIVTLLSYPASRSLDLLPYGETGRLLDVGCGAGHTLDRFKQEGWATSAVEINPEVAELVRQRGHQVFCGEIHDAHFPSGYFDAVIVEHTLEHVPDPAALLTEVRRILKPRGTVKIVVPNFGGVLARTFGRNWYMLDLPRHFYQFTLRTLRLFLQDSGFKVIRWGTKSDPEHILYSLQYTTHERKGRTHGVEPYSRPLYQALRPFCKLLDFVGIGDQLRVWAVPADSWTPIGPWR
jgi:SAM-dependent methyltransferase